MTQTPGEPRAHKVRAAWIAFVRRIVAQILGAVATIALGVLFLYTYQGDGQAASARQLEARIVRAAGQGKANGVAIAVLPLANFSPDPREACLAAPQTSHGVGGFGLRQPVTVAADVVRFLGS